jgi:hypothetical protein
MARNNYFKVSSRESNLFEQLVVEQIKIYGFDVHYIFRKFQNLDNLFGEDPVSKFTKSFQVEMFVSNYEFFESQNKLMDKFGINIQDSVNLMVSKKRFSEEAARYGTDTSPQEGDLIYLPMADRLMYVKYVNKTPVFYQMGSIQMYDLVCEMFEYSGEQLNTGIAAIDNIERDLSLSLDLYNITTSDGLILITQDGTPIIQSGYSFETQAGDPFEDNTEFELEGDSILDWTQIDPFSEGNV